MKTVPDPIVFFQLRQMLDKLILSTPIGEVRNLLTDANICLLEAESASMRGNEGGEEVNNESTLYTLLAAKSDISLEQLGMRHSSGKSARKHWALLLLHLPARASYDAVILAINKEIENVFQQQSTIPSDRK